MQNEPRRRDHVVAALAAIVAVAALACEDDRDGGAPTLPDAAVAAGGAGGTAGTSGNGGSGGAAVALDAAVTSDGGSDAGARADVASDAGSGGAQPLYLLGGTIFGTPSVSYVVPVSSLAANTPVDYTAGVPIVGGAALYGPERAGHFFVGSGESPTLTRFEVSPSGVFTKGKTLSLAGLGFSSACSSVRIEALLQG
jgi:hypothetical protein